MSQLTTEAPHARTLQETSKSPDGERNPKKAKPHGCARGSCGSWPLALWAALCWSSIARPAAERSVSGWNSFGLPGAGAAIKWVARLS